MHQYAVALLAIALSTPAVAQEWVNIDIWGNGILGQTALRHAEEATRESGSGQDRPSRRSDSRRPPSPATLSFDRSSDLTSQVEEAVADRLSEMVSVRFRLDDPAYFVKTAGTRAIYRQELERRGLPEDSVSGATALFLAVGWELANGRQLSAAQNAAILRQTASSLQSTPLARQSDARQQQEAEMRLIIAALWLQEARLRASSPDLTRDISEAVWNDMKTITRNDMRAYSVTSSGFTER